MGKVKKSSWKIFLKPYNSTGTNIVLYYPCDILLFLWQQDEMITN